MQHSDGKVSRKCHRQQHVPALKTLEIASKFHFEFHKSIAKSPTDLSKIHCLNSVLWKDTAKIYFTF